MSEYIDALHLQAKTLHMETKDLAIKTPLKTGVDSCALEGREVRAPLVAPVMLRLLQSRW